VAALIAVTIERDLPYYSIGISSDFVHRMNELARKVSILDKHRSVVLGLFNATSSSFLATREQWLAQSPQGTACLVRLWLVPGSEAFRANDGMLG
jgi:hypothetical protein